MFFEAARRTTEGAVQSGQSVIHTITISPLTATPTAGLLTVYDNTAESGTILFSEWVFAGAVARTVILDCVARTGIYVGFDAALANVSVTVTYSR